MIPKIIGIRFSDNDFGNTIRLFLSCIMQREIKSYADYMTGSLTKEQVVYLFHKSASGLYYLSQYRAIDGMSPFDPGAYLKIGIEDVFFDDEVKEFIETQGGGCNGEFHVLDTYVFQPYVYSV